MRFQLASPNQINSEQLIQELRSVLPLESLDLVFWPPDEVEIHEYTEKDVARGHVPAHRAVGDVTPHRERIQQVIAAHVPGERGGARRQLKNTAQGAVGTSVDGLSRKQLDDLLRCLLSRDGALDDAGLIRPLDEWM